MSRFVSSLRLVWLARVAMVAAASFAVACQGSRAHQTAPAVAVEPPVASSDPAMPVPSVPVAGAAQGGAQRFTDPVDPAAHEITAAAYRAHMEFLADDRLEGRMSGQPGYELAAQYVADQFESYGLEPGVDGKSYLQPVPLRITEVDHPATSFEIIRHGQTTPLAVEEHFVFRGTPTEAEVELEASVVYVGFGVQAPEVDYDDYRGVDVRGKIVAYFMGAPSQLPDHLRAYHSSFQRKREVASSLGAVGVIRMLTPADEARYQWPRLTRHLKVDTMFWRQRDGVTHDSYPQLRVFVQINGAAMERLFEGAMLTVDAVHDAARQGRPDPLVLPARVRLRGNNVHRDVPVPNVVAVLRGSDPELASEYVVLSGHLDHLGVGDQVDGDAIYNGAIDNASGIACMLEVARAFSRAQSRPRRSLLFLAVCAEERGLVGSDYFANNPTVPIESIVANLNFDTVMLNPPLRDVVAFGADHSSLGNAVARAAEQLGLFVSPDPIPNEVILVRSDQYSFVKQGVPALMLMPGFDRGNGISEGMVQFQKWISERYHNPADDMGQDMDFDVGAKFARVNFLAAWHIAQDEQRPSWNPGDFFETTFANKRGETTD